MMEARSQDKIPSSVGTGSKLKGKIGLIYLDQLFWYTLKLT